MPYVTLGKSSLDFVEFYVFDENSKQCGTLYYFYSKIKDPIWKKSGNIPKEIDEDKSNIERIATSILISNLKAKDSN